MNRQVSRVSLATAPARSITLGLQLRRVLRGHFGFVVSSADCGSFGRPSPACLPSEFCWLPLSAFFFRLAVCHRSACAVCQVVSLFPISRVPLFTAWFR